MNFEDYIFGGILCLFVAVFVLLMFVYLPTTLAVDARCLEAGYPTSAITWKLDGYCMNLEGTVTVGVDAAPET